VREEQFGAHQAVVNKQLTKQIQAKPEAAERVRKLRVLLLASVDSQPETVARWGNTMDVLERTGDGDVFNYVFFHFDGQTENWEKEKWYRENPNVALKVDTVGCKVEYWHSISERVEMLSTYDYVWVIDSDIELRLFNWSTYRLFLFLLDPLLSQPGVLGVKGSEGERSADYPHLTFKCALKNAVEECGGDDSGKHRGPDAADFLTLPVSCCSSTL
jgi:hypothetical protein